MLVPEIISELKTSSSLLPPRHKQGFGCVCDASIHQSTGLGGLHEGSACNSAHYLIHDCVLYDPHFVVILEKLTVEQPQPGSSESVPRKALSLQMTAAHTLLPVETCQQSKSWRQETLRPMPLILCKPSLMHMLRSRV